MSKKKHVVRNTAKRNRSTTNYKRNYPKRYVRNHKRTRKVTDVLWTISLLVVGASGILLGVVAIADWMLPVLLLRGIGATGAVMLPILVVTTITKVKNTEQ